MAWRRPRGFTLIELVIVIALMAIVTATAVVSLRAARRNAQVGGMSFELVLKLQGLKTKALAEQRDHLAGVHAGDGGPAGCSRPTAASGSSSSPPRRTTGRSRGSLRPRRTRTSTRPPASWSRRFVFPKGTTLHGGAAGMAGKAPFTNVSTWDAALDGSCGGFRCVAFRFTRTGEVRGETPDGTVLRKPGHIVALATDLEGQTHGAERRAILVSVPLWHREVLHLLTGRA